MTKLKFHLSTTNKIIAFLFSIAITLVGTLLVLGAEGGQSGSFLNSNVIYVKPNVTDISSYLASQGVESANNPKFALQTNNILFDSNQRPQPQVSSYLNLPSATLVDQYGHLLDTGSVQTQVLAVGTGTEQVIVSGVITAYLDGNVVKQGRLTGQGVFTNKFFPLSIDGNPTIQFTLADEGQNWLNGTTHTYSIYLSNIQATVGTGPTTKTFLYAGQFLAYILDMKLDSNKIVELDSNGKAVSIFKSDDTVQEVVTNGENHQISAGSYAPNNFYYGTNYGLPVKVTINGFVIGSLQNFGTIPNLPRNADININIGGVNNYIHTPLTHNDFVISCYQSYSFRDGDNGENIYTHNGAKCTTNFNSTFSKIVP